jgi:hypothetical protein
MREHFFTGPSSIGVRHRNAFQPSIPGSTNDGEDEVEIPPSMLALVATAVSAHYFQDMCIDSELRSMPPSLNS